MMDIEQAPTAGGGGKAPQRRAVTAGQAYRAAAMLFRQGRLGEAEQIYRALLQLDPAHAGALRHLGILCTRTQRGEEAVALLERAVAAAPASAPAWNDLGLALSACQRPQDALAPLHRAVELAPSFADAHNNLGDALHVLGRHEEAAASFERALTENPDFAEAHNNLGNALTSLGREAEAIAHYDRAVALRPDLAEAHFNAGIALAAIRRPRQAIARYGKALALRPDYAGAEVGIGKALAQLERHREALAHFERALALQPGSPEAHNRVGNGLAALGRHEEALAHYRAAIELRPGLVEARNNLGSALVALRRHAEAVEEFRAVLAEPQAPDEAASYRAYNNLGGALLTLKRPHEALAAFEKAAVIVPDQAESPHHIGAALAAMDRHAEAVERYRAALAAKPDFAEAHSNLGAALIALNRADEAIACFEQALAINPELAAAHQGLGSAHMTLGRLDEARREFRRAIAIEPGRLDAHRSLAEAERFTPGDARLAPLEAFARDADALSTDDQTYLHFALGKAYADLQQPEAAFRHLLAAIALKRQETEYDEAVTIGKLARSQAAFTSELIGRLRGRGDPSDRPIFIVGMPRSGTTLIEQILASHPDVFGAGELMDFAHAASSICEPPEATIPYPEMMAAITQERLRTLGAAYLEAVAAAVPASQRARHFTDKMPANFRLVGLIHLALPNARIIHARRDPVDTCLSCFTKLFSGGQPFAYDLGELGRYYRAYESLMAHWRAVLPDDAMLEVRYEDLVGDFEPQARRIVAYCGLAWDEACLAFHRTQRPVLTASAVQVRQPLYASSVGRWRPYAPWLGPLLQALGPAEIRSS